MTLTVMTKDAKVDSDTANKNEDPNRGTKDPVDLTQLEFSQGMLR